MTDFSGFDVFSEKAAVADADRVQLLDPELLYPDPENVRSEIDPAKIDAQLRQGFEQHLRETEGQIERLRRVYELEGMQPKGVTCPASDGSFSTPSLSLAV